MIFSPKRLPPWVTPAVLRRGWFSIFGADTDKADIIGEYVFQMEQGLLAFQDFILHTPSGAMSCEQGVYWLPPEVLIAAGVEALRRKGLS
jgi:hypothetical protein